MAEDVNERLEGMTEVEVGEWFFGNRAVLGTGPVRCAHCSRICANAEAGYATVEGKFVCHPNVSGRPDCYRLLTVYKETLGSRREEGAEDGF